MGVSSAAVGARNNDDEDPLGLLPGAPRTQCGDVHDRRVDETSSPSRRLSMEPETTHLGSAGTDCWGGSVDPREAIDAILRSSQAARDQVAWRQVSRHPGQSLREHVLQSYETRISFTSSRIRQFAAGLSVFLQQQVYVRETSERWSDATVLISQTYIRSVILNPGRIATFLAT